jgi:D-glucuronyl C5-epimerase-like protein
LLRDRDRRVTVIKKLTLALLPALVASLIVAQPATSALPTFLTSGMQARSLAPGSLPYQSTLAATLAGFGLVDTNGVRMVSLGGQTFNHPVAQGQYALSSLDAYRLTGTQAYLDRAIANAQRLIDTRVESGAAWFYPYQFDFACCQGDTGMVLKAPWFSGMAQGVALSTFVRLFQVTKDQAWRTAADATFASFLIPPSTDQPWVSWVDADGHLWLEEYPRQPIDTSERVLNGLIFAAFGVYEYALLTGDPEALAVFDGAVTTAEQLAPLQFRQVKWAAFYSLQHRISSSSYQAVVTAEFIYLQHMTGRNSDALLADTLRADFPVQTSSGTGDFTPRTKIAYRLDSKRNIIGSRRIAFVRQTSARVDRRERTRSGLIMLRVAVGAYTNWWFPEAFGASWISGPVDVHAYDPPLTATLAPGRYGAYRFDSAGRRIGYGTLPVADTTSMPTTSSAVVDGRLSYYFATGPFVGFWVPANPSMAVA